jgi:hypothetical protein
VNRKQEVLGQVSGFVIFICGLHLNVLAGLAYNSLCSPLYPGTIFGMKKKTSQKKNGEKDKNK